MQDLKALSVSTVWKTQFSPQHSSPKREKSHKGSRDSLYKSCATVTISHHGSFQYPNRYGKKNNSTRKEESIKIISYMSNKTLLSRMPLPGFISGVRKATNTCTLLSPTALEKNTEFAHGGLSVSLIALYSQGIWFLLVLSLINTLRVQSWSF